MNRVMRVTTKQLREILNLKSDVASNSIMNLLKETGNAIPVGKAKVKGRGKPPTIYEIPQVVTMKLFDDALIDDAIEEAVETAAEVAVDTTNTVLETA